MRWDEFYTKVRRSHANSYFVKVNSGYIYPV